VAYCWVQKRPTCVKRDVFICQTPYLCKKTPTKETYWLWITGTALKREGSGLLLSANMPLSQQPQQQQQEESSCTYAPCSDADKVILWCSVLQSLCCSALQRVCAILRRRTGKWVLQRVAVTVLQSVAVRVCAILGRRTGNSGLQCVAATVLQCVAVTVLQCVYAPSPEIEQVNL